MSVPGGLRLALHARGGPGIGVGHLVRCLALAQEAVARGWSVSIDRAVEVPWLRAEFDALGVVGTGTGADVHVVDSYEHVPAPGSGLLLNVEDGQFGRRPADIVVDPNLAVRPRPDDGSALVLRGPEYAMLRRGVRSARRGPRGFADPLRVAVTLGGSRLAAEVSARLVRLLEATGVPLRCTVFGELHEAAVPGWVRVSPPAPELPDRLAAADVVVSAAGITLLEACCIGTPLVLVCLVDNQKTGYRAALDAELAAGLGHADTLVDAATLAAVLADHDGLAARAARARATVDGAGAARVLDAAANAVGAGG